MRFSVVHARPTIAAEPLGAACHVASDATREARMKVPGLRDVSAVAVAPAMVLSLRRPAPAPSKAVAQMRSIGRSGAAPAPTSNADDWEEF